MPHLILSQVVIKMPKTTSQDVRVEIDMMRKLQHPHIIKLLDVVTHPDTGALCPVMEYAPNGDLLRRLNNQLQPLYESQAKQLFAQLVSAVEYLHSINVVHIDIKPENMLLDSNGNLKVGDFGLSCTCTPGSLLYYECGTQLYWSPEIFTHRPYDGRSADIWAMGVVLYAMVTRQFPWKGTNECEQVAHAQRGEYQLPEYLSAECSHLIKRMLVVAPAQRATIAEIKQHPWLRTS
jgi:serine/threonine protein kinase